jgi:hypothetical protein
MALAAQQPYRRHWFSGRRTAISARGELLTARAPGVGAVALLTALLGAWVGIATFVGPDFGWRPTVAGSWQWVMVNWLLHLIPGAAAFVGGLLVLARSPARQGGPNLLSALAALLVLLAGFWLVIGPAAWPVFESTPAFNTLASTNRAFLDALGASLGPGVLLAAFGGMALKAAITRPRMDAAEPKHASVSPGAGPGDSSAQPPAAPAGGAGY